VVRWAFSADGAALVAPPRFCHRKAAFWSTTVDTDRNLLFGVLALQADLLTPVQFAEACSAWAGRKDLPLADLLVKRGWLDTEQRKLVDLLLRTKLQKHGGDLRASLAEVTSDRVRCSLANIADAEIQQSLAPPPTPQGHVLLSTSEYVPDARDRYTLSRLHATGGIGRVWLARDASLGRDVALKELRPERAGQPALWTRFLREAQVTGQLEHPGIVPVYDVGRRPDDQAPFYTMRFVRGRTLAEAARHFHERRGRGEASRLELRELLTAIVSLCQAVAYAHSRGVLHRDLKPQNVVLGDYGEVMLLDWGLAKVARQPDSAAEADREPVALSGEAPRDATVAGQVLGTPAYMAPEQAEGRVDVLDARTDVYGLGAVLYEVLAGQPPFRGDDTTSVLRRVVHEPPASPRGVVPDVPRALEAICLRALAKRPADRYPTPQALAEDVKRYLADEPVSAYRDPVTTQLTRWGRRHRTLAVSLVVLVLAALGGLAAVLGVQAHANAKLEAKNAELAEQQAEVEARFAMAQQAIATFHTGVSEDALLKNHQLRELRKKLLKEAAGFYADLEKLLAGKTDKKSRQMLAEGYSQLGDLTAKIGDRTEALAVHRKALALRRMLAATPEAGVEARLGLARSIRVVGNEQYATGDHPGALASFEEARALAEAVAAEDSMDTARSLGAKCRYNTGVVLSEIGRHQAALAELRQALATWQKLSGTNPGVPELQRELANGHQAIAWVLSRAGQPQEGLPARKEALSLRQELAKANRHDPDLQRELALSHQALGALLEQLGQPETAIPEYREALVILQQLHDSYPAVTEFQSDLALAHHNIAEALSHTRPPEALAEFKEALGMRQKVADANPNVPDFQRELGFNHYSIGTVLERLRKPADALLAYAQARALQQKLADAHPPIPEFRSELAMSCYRLGRLLAYQGRIKEAFPALDHAQKLCQALSDAQSGIAEHLLRLGYSHAFRGAAHMRAGNPAAAAADLRQAAALWAKIAIADAEDHFDRSRALAQLAGLAWDAKSGVTAVEAAAYADQAVAALRDALRAGWSMPDELTEPDFDAIRRRDDFQKLLTDQAKKGAGAGEGR
jgi:serine/threonine-protein kinase